MWAYYGQKKFKFIEPGDVDTAIQSANSIGDDRLQKRARAGCRRRSITHGTSAQRVRFFTEGLKTGDDTKQRLDRFFSAGFNAAGELE